MQLALTILAGIGALLFVISFLAYVISGFRHHFVTGIIAMLPVLNIITLPSLWQKSRGKFIVGLIGLIVFIGAWFLGADKGLRNLLVKQDTNILEEIVISATPGGNTLKADNTSKLAANSDAMISTSAKAFDESEMHDLPTKALYKIGFDTVPVNSISTLQGRTVQIIKTDNIVIEGRIKSVSAASVVLEGLFENELPVSSIKQLKLLGKMAK